MKRFYLLFFVAACAFPLNAQTEWTSRYLDSWENGQWHPEYHHLRSFNAQGKTDTLFEYYNSSGGWELIYICLHDYNAQGQLVQQSVEYVNPLTWDIEIHYDYFLNGNLDKVTHYYQDGTTGVWTERFRFEYAYTPESLLYREFMFVIDDGEVFSGTRLTYSYDAAGQTDETELESLAENGVSWVPNERSVYTYEAGLPVQRFTETWVEEEGIWINYLLTHFFYNGNETIDTEIDERWNYQESMWENRSRRRYYYTPLSVEEESGIQAAVYPTPVDDQLYIAFGSGVSGEAVLTDLTGKALTAPTATGALHILDTKELPAGVYLLHLHMEGKAATRKIIKS